MSSREFRNPLFTHFRSLQARSFSFQDHGDEPHKCKECCVEQLVPHSLGRITYCIGTNNTWYRPYTSGAVRHSFATITGADIQSATEHFGTHKNTMCCVGLLYLWTKTRIAFCCTYHWLDTSHLALSSRSRPLAVAKKDCDDIDNGLDYIPHSQRPPDSEKGSMENITGSIRFQIYWGCLENIFVRYVPLQ